MSSTRSSLRPRVAAFYSYKGGVGRTLLAANVAVAMAARGKTLIWDLDVEAPGMQYIPALRSPSKVNEGFLEWLRDWRRDSASQPTEASSGETVPIADEERRRFAALVRPTSIHQLYCLPALSEQIDPAKVYQAIDWSWFEREPAQALGMFDLLLSELRAQGFERVVVDSRTGYTDLGALLVGLLPDASVLVGGYGEQNLRGLARIWKALRSDRPELAVMRQGRPMPRLELVASPIPQHDPVLAAQGRKKWSQAFGLDLVDVYEIPFDNELPFTEKLMLSAEPGREVAKKYAQVAQVLVRHFDLADAEQHAHTRSEKGPQTRGEALEERVRHLLGLLDYQIEAGRFVDEGFDLQASLRIGLEEVRYVVECTALVTIEKISRLVATLRTLRAEEPALRGMIVAGETSTPEARALAESNAIRLLSVDELERQLLDPADYLRAVAREYEQSPLHDTYVDPVASPDGGVDGSYDRGDTLIEASVRWARGEGPSLWAIVGERGVGKSAFAARACHQIARSVLDNPIVPVPILVRLREPRRSALALGEVLADGWHVVTGERKAPAVFDHLLRQGRVIALLDGLDEMSSFPPDTRATDIWSALLDTVGDGATSARVLVTSVQDPRSYVGTGQPQLRVTRLAPPSALELAEHVRLRLGPSDLAQLNALIAETGSTSKPSRWLDALRLASPALAHREISSGEAFGSPGHLYQAMIDRWLAAATGPETLSLSSTAVLIEEIAWFLWSRNSAVMDTVELHALSKRLDLDPARVELAVRRLPFISRSSSGELGFEHRSLHEFCLARGVLRRSEDSLTFFGLAERLSLPLLSEQVLQFVHELTQNVPSHRSTLATKLQQLLLVADSGSSSASLMTKANALVLAHALAYLEAGGESQQAEVRAQCERYIPENAFLEGISLNRVKLVGVVLRGARLARASLDGSDLTGADLRKAALDGASLKQVKLTFVHLGDASLSHADLTGALIREVNFDGADASGSVWHGAEIGRLSVDGADFDGADLSRAAKIDRSAGALLSKLPSKPRLPSSRPNGSNLRRINLNEPYELSYWSRRFGVSEEALKEAVERVGTTTQRVVQHFQETALDR